MTSGPPQARSRLRAEDLEIKRAMIARAADKADATVEKWANNARALIDQMHAQTRHKWDPTDERRSFACDLCDTEFEVDDSDFAFSNATTNMYRHWKTSHTAARTP